LSFDFRFRLARRRQRVLRLIVFGGFVTESFSISSPTTGIHKSLPKKKKQELKPKNEIETDETEL